MEAAAHHDLALAFEAKMKAEPERAADEPRRHLDVRGVGLVVDDLCFVFKDGRQFCTNEDYTLVFYINGEQVSDIREYEIMEDDRILISYGAETPEEIESQLLQLENQELVK